MKTRLVGHHRHSLRACGYDYSGPGAYFVTMCSHQHQCVFGEIVNGKMKLGVWGKIVEEEWLRSAGIRREIELDVFVIMPNHLHGIVIIHADVGATGRSPLLLLPHNPAIRHGPGRRSLVSLIAGFKSAVTKRINTLRGAAAPPVWQRNYYDHIVRDDADLLRCGQYALDNPLKWELDENHPDHFSGPARTSSPTSPLPVV